MSSARTQLKTFNAVTLNVTAPEKTLYLVVPRVWNWWFGLLCLETTCAICTGVHIKGTLWLASQDSLCLGGTAPRYHNHDPSLFIAGCRFVGFHLLGIRVRCSCSVLPKQEHEIMILKRPSGTAAPPPPRPPSTPTHAHPTFACRFSSWISLQRFMARRKPLPWSLFRASISPTCSRKEQPFWGFPFFIFLYIVP